MILITIGFNLWTLIELSQTKRSKKTLFFVIPVTLFLAISSYFIISMYAGYPTNDTSKLQKTEWNLISHHIDFEHEIIYILVHHKDEIEPRLYKIDTNFEENKKAIQKASQATKQGIPVKGKMTRNGEIDNEGNFKFYVLPPSELIKKDQ